MALSTLPTLAQIDIHSHAITENYIDFVKANGAEMDEGFPIPSWNLERHIAFMDKAGIQTSVLTMPAPQPYFGDAKASANVCRRFNEECTALKARYPGRFMFCAALPLPDVESALREAKYALETLGAEIGKAIGSCGKVLVTGGGAYNKFLIDNIRRNCNSEIIIPDDTTINYKEAIIFAFLGLLRICGKDNCLSSITGAKKDSCCGVVAVG